MSADTPSGFEPYEDSGEFLDLIGPVHVGDRDGARVFGLRVEERHRNAAGAAHGGLLATLVDFSLGRAINAELGEDAGAVTVSLTTDYLGPAQLGDWVEAHTEVERVGGTLAFADCSLKVDGDEIVRGRAVFAVLS